MDKYDYIVTGAGASGLSLLMHMISSGRFSDKKILLVDKDRKQANDRTWCFWEKEPGLFEEVVYKRWSSMWFHSRHRSSLHDIGPYEYKLIRGIDFYNHCFSVINAQPNITILHGEVRRIESSASGTYVIVNGNTYFADYIFNSIFFRAPELRRGEQHLLQHFKGWVVKTQSPTFNPEHAVLMDFRVRQSAGDTTFVYVMPFSDRSALVEFTIFGKALLSEEQYDQALREYCKTYLGISDYTIEEKEFGIIPMTDHRFPRAVYNIVNIGTAGGQTKASSGYTFRFIQKNSQAIVQSLIWTGRPFVKDSLLDNRFHLYDRTLLRILAAHRFPGSEIFSILMRSNRMQEVFKFLDNETSIVEELKIIRKLPKGVFLRSVFG